MKLQDQLAKIPAKIFWASVIIVIISLVLIANSKSDTPTLAEKTREVASQLRCLECEGLSVYDSDTPTSKTIVKDVKRRLSNGQTKADIFSFYEDSYGEYIRLSPVNKKGNWLIYVVPVFLVGVFIGAIYISVRKKTSKRTLLLYWAATGVLFVGGLIVFVNNAQEKTQTQTETRQISTLERLQKAVDDEPTAGNYRNLAIVQFAQEDYVNALINFDNAAKIDSSDAESRAYAAYIVLLSGQFDTALSRVQEAVAVDANSVPALFFRGVIYREMPTDNDMAKQANLDKANADFDNVLLLAPESEFAKQIREVRDSEGK